MKSIIEKKDYYKGHEYFIKFFEDGHRCGYVKVPEGHRFYGEEYCDIPVFCHGGLTFSEEILNEESDFSVGFWIGFDCAHSGDGYDFDKVFEVFGHSEYAESMKRFVLGGTIRDMDYVEKQCIYIIGQLVAAERKDDFFGEDEESLKERIENLEKEKKKEN